MLLVYQAYGSEAVVRQALFSLTSLLAVLGGDSPLRVLVYTDRAEEVAAFLGGHPRVGLREVSPGELRAWRGAIDFVHRVKVEALLDAAGRAPGPLFYVDGDTWFRRDPGPEFRQVADGVSLLHVAEGRLCEGRDPLARKIARFARRHEFRVGGRPYRIPPDAMMWNAGAIGIAAGNTRLLRDVLELTDQMHARYAKHVMEQLAFSVVLAGASEVRPLDGTIGHYWDRKEAYQGPIDAFLARNPGLGAALAAYPGFAHPAPRPPGGRRPVWRRLLDRLRSLEK